MHIRNLIKRLLRFVDPFPRQWICGYLEWSLIKRLLQIYSINCVLDVGANRGQFAENLRRIGYKGRICSFEPIPYEFEHITRLFVNDPNWRGFPIALGNSNGEQILYVPSASTAMSSFLKPKDASWQLTEISVPIRKLDDVFEEAVTGIPQPNVMLKIDTQGYDLEVVKGGMNCMARVTCLQSEVAITPIYEGVPTYLSVLAEYEKLGFQLVGFAEVFRQEASASLVEANCLLVRRERARQLGAL